MWYPFRGNDGNDDVKFIELWTGFRQNTTAHGIPHVANAIGKLAYLYPFPNVF